MEQWLSPSHPDSPEAPNMNMMITVGENTARKVGVSREEMDEWSFGSHRKAVAAIDEGRFADEILPMEVTSWAGPTAFDTDEHPRRNTSLEKLSSLRVLSGLPDGTITAGNSSSINDGASAVLLGGEGALPGEPLARVVSRAAHGTDPDVFPLAPIEAANKALARAGRTWADVDVVELNEAFASQSLADIAGWEGLDPEKVNIHGGALAIGHPLGASGGRIIGHAAHELARRGSGVAVAAICIGVGQGLAVVLER